MSGVGPYRKEAGRAPSPTIPAKEPFQFDWSYPSTAFAFWAGIAGLDTLLLIDATWTQWVLVNAFIFNTVLLAYAFVRGLVTFSSK